LQLGALFIIKAVFLDPQHVYLIALFGPASTALAFVLNNICKRPGGYIRIDDIFMSTPVGRRLHPYRSLAKTGLPRPAVLALVIRRIDF